MIAQAQTVVDFESATSSWSGVYVYLLSSVHVSAEWEKEREGCKGT